MYERVTRMTRKGQITLPVEIRRALGLQVGDTVSVSLGGGESPTAEVKRAVSVADQTFGAVAPRKSPEDFKELRQLFIEGQGSPELDAPEALKNLHSS